MAQASEVEAIVPATVLSSMPGWEELSSKEKSTVERETKHLITAIETHGLSRLAIGEHALAVQEVLEPRRMFVKYLEIGFPNMGVKTVYRRINEFKYAREFYPESIVRLAMASGIDLTGGATPKRPRGIYTEAVKRLPPPKNPSPEKAKEWLDSVEKIRVNKIQRSREKPIVQDPDNMTEEVVRFFRSRFKLLPRGGKVRPNFTRMVVGMIMTESGLASSTSFDPIAVPQEYRTGPGRPREKSPETESD